MDPELGHLLSGILPLLGVALGVIGTLLATWISNRSQERRLFDELYEKRLQWIAELEMSRLREMHENLMHLEDAVSKLAGIALNSTENIFLRSDFNENKKAMWELNEKICSYWAIEFGSNPTEIQLRKSVIRFADCMVNKRDKQNIQHSTDEFVKAIIEMRGLIERKYGEVKSRRQYK